MTILERLEFLDQTQKGPSDVTSTDVHGKVLEILHWAEREDNAATVSFPTGTAIAFANPLTGARIELFGNLVTDSAS